MSKMTGREALLQVLRRQPADRIPVSPFIHVNYVKEFFGANDVDYVARTPEVYRHFGFDIMHRNCSIAYDAYGETARHWDVTTQTEVDGRDLTSATVVQTPTGSSERPTLCGGCTNTTPRTRRPIIRLRLSVTSTS